MSLRVIFAERSGVKIVSRSLAIHLFSIHFDMLSATHPDEFVGTLELTLV